MLFIANGVSIPEIELDFSAIRAQGPGGQNVNKVSSAIHLRFDIQQSSLPDFYKQRLLKLNDQRISKDGVVIIKAQSYRSQDKNRVEALSRLQLLVQSDSDYEIKDSFYYPAFNTSIKNKVISFRKIVSANFIHKVSIEMISN